MKRFILILLIAISIAYTGCSDDTQTPPPPTTDTTVANYNNLIIAERTVPFDEALSGVDFYNGLIVRDSSRNKDANLVDSLFIADSVYYFRSGDLSDIHTNSVPGYQTRFKLVYATLTQAEFDTVKVIPDSDTSLTENDFTMDNTESFTYPLVLNTVYGFYLKGKFDNGLTPKPVFGLLYLERTYYDATGFKLVFDVKINKAGQTNLNHNKLEKIIMKDAKVIKGVLYGLLAGSIAGGIAALLLAPKSGKELRKDISKKKDKMIKDTEKYLSDARKQATKIIDKSMKKADTVIEDAKKKMENLKNKSVNLYESGKEKIISETHILKDALKAGTEAYKEERKSA